MTNFLVLVINNKFKVINLKFVSQKWLNRLGNILGNKLIEQFKKVLSFYLLKIHAVFIFYKQFWFCL